MSVNIPSWMRYQFITVNPALHVGDQVPGWDASPTQDTQHDVHCICYSPWIQPNMESPKNDCTGSYSGWDASSTGCPAQDPPPPPPPPNASGPRQTRISYFNTQLKPLITTKTKSYTLIIPYSELEELVELSLDELSSSESEELSQEEESSSSVLPLCVAPYSLLMISSSLSILFMA